MPAGEGLRGRVLAAGRGCCLASSVLEEWSGLGTPRQVERLAGFLEAEAAGRDASKRAALLRRCALPAPKSFDGYDWSCARWPEGFGREDLPSPSFLDAGGGLVLMGDVGAGKTHMASAPCALACERGEEARLFTASSLVMRLRRARDEGRLDRELRQLGRARLLVLDELGFLPLGADGARLLFQVVSGAYERRSPVITTNLEFSRWGAVFGYDQMAAAVIDRVVHHGGLVQFLECPPRRKPLRLSTVEGSSEDAPRSSEAQDPISLTNGACQAAAVADITSSASRSGADVVAGENDLAARSLRAACQIDASSNLHVGEK